MAVIRECGICGKRSGDWREVFAGLCRECAEKKASISDLRAAGKAATA